MKKFSIIFISLILFFLMLVVKSTYASSSPLSLFGDTKLLGLDCGRSDNPDMIKRKCCSKPIPVSLDERIKSVMPTFGCLINAGGIKGFCISDIAMVPIGFVIGKLDPIAKFSQTAPIQPCLNGTPTINDQPTSDYSNKDCICRTDISSFSLLCKKYLQNSKEYNSCLKCEGIWTGIGCIRSNIQSFITDTVFNIGIGLAGIISLFCIIFSAIQMQTSQGNPEKLKKAQEILTSCIMGLMLIIFSIFILRIIGVDILRIPRFK